VALELSGFTTKVVPLAALVAVLVGSKVDVAVDESIVKVMGFLHSIRAREAKQLVCRRPVSSIVLKSLIKSDKVTKCRLGRIFPIGKVGLAFVGHILA
jgi:hypothetical protein